MDKLKKLMDQLGNGSVNKVNQQFDRLHEDYKETIKDALPRIISTKMHQNDGSFKNFLDTVYIVQTKTVSPSSWASRGVGLVEGGGYLLWIAVQEKMM